MIRRWLRDGEVRRVLQGVYIGTHVPDSPTVRARAVAAVVPDAVICGRTAAWLWGVTAAGDTGADGRPLPVEFVVPTITTPPRRSGCLGRSWTLEKGDITTVAGLTATTPQRTAADVGRSAGGEDAVVILDAFLRLRLVTRSQLVGAMVRFAGYAGVRGLAHAVRLADGRSAGADESRLRYALSGAGAPPPEPGWRVTSAAGRSVHRFGLAWPLLRLGVDVTAPRGDRAEACARPAGSDDAPPAIRVRRRHVAGQAWRVVECDPGVPTHDRDAVVARILRELRAAADAGARAA
ncbi:hypothetical protein LO772_23895 [Yinghuangia sp. ASG 101]|uniref:hypothetical protein n=1 Tax=Yinghuangia sp. ASG 101 TaxID=2896848 RepID=UPI001E3CE92B|nr:hypothetical protein [Yinghuangia sp. ASG 101]UGQ09920.1 hypothetical protein LO772_23895 [Yinghuangia sp. ASG 101]